MENPKCPYCERVMAQRLYHGLWSYKCPECGASSPECEIREEAYAAAMKRDRAKGEWITVSESAWEGGEYKCSACGWKCCDDEFGDDPTEDYRFCPNCGAEMRKEEKDDSHYHTM